MFNSIIINMFRSQKLLAVSLNGLAILVTNFAGGRVAHSIIPRKESYYAFQVPTRASVKGLFVRWVGFLFNFENKGLIESKKTLFSYDGSVFYNQADSKNGHHFTTMAKIDGAPLAVGGFEPNIKKAEILDISSNVWTEVAEYPYHN